ncbi:Histone-lysine N-methyltransferase SETMAR-like [Oopsacas minuta]|uniref:Histone-lysine N-methyltransferase SETMAR-like n=1 Tax=Oopsacas minuta TaxID=111878 RepID=A0AAV7JQZ4_9METZ|nr:Histone-lysine N-methyltransferase SETMAR-like [Oopsacas minuta]
MVMEDKCITVNQLEQSMEISSGAIHTILTTELGYRSICGKWVPHKLSENQRLARLNIAKKLLETYENCDSRRLTEINTGDETWVYYSTPYKQVLPNLIKNIEKYRPKTGTRGMKILIDNASSHTAKLTKNFLDVEGLELDLEGQSTHKYLLQLAEDLYGLDLEYCAKLYVTSPFEVEIIIL